MYSGNVIFILYLKYIFKRIIWLYNYHLLIVIIILYYHQVFGFAVPKELTPLFQSFHLPVRENINTQQQFCL